MPSEPNSTEVADLVKVARAHQKAGAFADAESLFRDAARIAPRQQNVALGLVNALEAQGKQADAEAILRAFIHDAPENANILAASRKWAAWENADTGGRKLGVALVGSGTLATLGDHLRVALAQADLRPRLRVGEFNQWAQELLDPKSPVLADSPDLIFLRLEPADLLPKTLENPFLPDADAITERESTLSLLDSVFDSVAARLPNATLVVHTIAQPEFSPLGVLDINAPGGLRERIDSFNAGLLTRVRTRLPKVVALDQERIESSHGKNRVRDSRLWHLASFPYSESFLPVVADAQARLALAILGRAKKCVVLDLDNTLWGGVVGEDGVDALVLGETGPGAAFSGFQTALLQLRARGVLLAVCSKNNEADAWAAFENHPGMKLRRDHLSAWRIDWRDKATNLAEIARELNLGVDSLVFCDDSPMERALVSQRLPQVLTVEMPADPSGYVRALWETGAFETLAVTDEDRRRADLYTEQRQRDALEQASGDLDAYLHSLGTVVTLARADSFALARVTQLLNKTNQFNLTTRRYTEAQIQAFAASPDALIATARVSDRFGDSGLTGITIARRGADTWEIDSFLMSCRVLGRGVETSLLAYLHNLARDFGAVGLDATFRPTEKNAPAQTFLPDHGFELITTDADGSTRWRLPISNEPMVFPTWLTVESDAKTG